MTAQLACRAMEHVWWLSAGAPAQAMSQRSTGPEQEQGEVVLH